MNYDIAIILIPVAALAVGFCFGYFVRDTLAENERAERNARHLHTLATMRDHAEKRASWQYHQGAIDTMNALEPKRDKAGRFVSNKTVIAKTEGSLSL